MGGGGGGGSGPTVQQQQLETMQAQQNAGLNLEENNQRKTILNAMQGTRVFRGSALSRAVAGNTDATGAAQAPPASKAQTATSLAPPTVSASLLDSPRAGTTSSTGATGVQQVDEEAARAQATNAAALYAAYAAR